MKWWDLVKQLRGFLFLFFFCAGVFPVSVTLISMVFFPSERAGSFLYRSDGTPLGSLWVAQPFQSAKYFWGRPSLAPQLVGPSQASHFSFTDKRLMQAQEERAQQWRSHHGDTEPPPEMVAASGSGFDPHISPVAAVLQIERVMKARGLSGDSETLRRLIEDLTEPPTFGVFGESRVNVLKLNLALDEKLPVADKE